MRELRRARPGPIEREMTTLIRRLGKGYCAAGDGFYCFDEDLSRVLQRVAEFTHRLDCEAASEGPRERQTERAAGERRKPAAT
jgi:hypothetical protein